MSNHRIPVIGLQIGIGRILYLMITIFDDGGASRWLDFSATIEVLAFVSYLVFT
jgi:hypothetical protein